MTYAEITLIDSRSISKHLADLGFNNCRDGGSSRDYRHTITRADDGTIIGRMAANEACDFINEQELLNS